MNYARCQFSFEGRIGRAKFWLAGLTILCWMMALGALILAVGSVFGGPRSFHFGIDDIFRSVDPASYRSLSLADLAHLFVKITGTALFLWLYLGASIKRLHDRDKSAWWMIPFFVVPGLFNQFEDRLGDSYAVMLVAVVSFVFCVWGFVEIGCRKGTRGSNRYGADPLAPPDTRPRWDQQSELEFVPHSAGPSPASHVKRGHE